MMKANTDVGLILLDVTIHWGKRVVWANSKKHVGEVRNI